MLNKLVSIIMPAYNVADVIGDSINSVLRQSYEEWELLIADDCSHDTTRETIEKFEVQDSRIKLIRLEKNGGPAAARNAALLNARGRWIAFLDSDDLWMPEKLELAIAYAIANKAALLYTGFRRMSADGSLLTDQIHVPKSVGYRDLLGNTVIATSTVLIDRTLVGHFFMRQTYYDDFDCWLQILKQGFVGHGLDLDLMRYRIMSSSVSRNKWRSAKHVWRAYRDLERLSVLSAVWYFMRYSINGYLKYRKFRLERPKP